MVGWQILKSYELGSECMKGAIEKLVMAGVIVRGNRVARADFGKAVRVLSSSGKWRWKYRELQEDEEKVSSYQGSKPALVAQSLVNRLRQDYPGSKLTNAYPSGDVFVLTLEQKLDSRTIATTIHAEAIGDDGAADLPGGHDVKMNKQFLDALLSSFKATAGSAYGEEDDEEEQEQEQDEPEEDQPEDYDGYITDSGPLGSKYSVSIEQKFLGEFDTMGEAEEALKEYCDKRQYWPNIWYVSDHGNAHLHSL